MATATGFDDTKLAARMRDAIRRLAIQTLDEERPPYKYGTVTAIYPDLRKVDVQFPGDATSVPVKVLGTQPVSTGQVVQVSGRSGDRFISGVIGSTKVTDVTEADLGTPTGLSLDASVERVTFSWNEVSNAYRYEVQFAEDSGFTTNVRTFYTTATTLTLDNLNADTDIWARVRAMNNAKGAGLYATAGPVTVEDFPVGKTDGTPPASSPDPVITEGLGYLLAEWLPVTNTDPVTYEVHISTTSGFTPSGSTKIGETGSTFFFTKRDAAGAELAFDTTYFIRIVAKDGDGAAGPSAQGSGQIDKVETGDVGTIDPDAMTDGAAPSSSPSATVTPGIGYLYTTWDHVTNPDPLTYEVHVSTTTGFAPSSNTKVGETPSNWFFIRKEGPGAGGGDLSYGVTYYVKLIAKDADGAAVAGTQGSATVLRTQTVDIETSAITETEIADGSVSSPKIVAGSVTAGKMEVGTITAASGIIADAAITTAKIADLAVDSAKISDLSVTTAKIADLSVSQAKIASLAVGEAQIADAAIATAKIQDAAITNAKIDSLSAGKIQADTVWVSGLINAGHAYLGRDVHSGWDGLKLEANQSNSSNVIMRRRSDSAILLRLTGPGGELLEFDTRGPHLKIANASLEAANFKTATSGKRIEIVARWGTGIADSIEAYTGNAAEVEPGRITSGATAQGPYIQIAAPDEGNGAGTFDHSFIRLWEDDILLDAGPNGDITLQGGPVTIDGNLTVTGFADLRGNAAFVDALNILSGTGEIKSVTDGYGIFGPVGLSAIQFIRDGTTDILHLSANDQLYVGSGSGIVLSPTIRDNHSSSTADIAMNNSTGEMLRITSSLRYKPGWEWVRDTEWANLADTQLPDPITWEATEDDGAVPTGTRFIGFGAEHVAEVLPDGVSYNSDGQPENIDLRAIVAVLSAKMKRLEERVLT